MRSSPMSNTPPDKPNDKPLDGQSDAESPPPLELLQPFERTAFRAMDFLHRRALPATELWLRTIGAGWMTVGSRNMMHPVGLERLAGLNYDNGILLVSNHRSFFDLYMLMLLLH